MANNHRAMVHPRYRLAFIIAAIAIVVRILYSVAYPQLPLINDSAAYATLGMNVATGYGYTLDASAPDTYWPPGYPLFIAMLFRIFGEELLVARITQAILGGALVLMTYLLAEKLFGRNTATVASSITALYPGLVLYSGMILTETLYATLFLAVVVLLLRKTWNGLCMVAIGALVGLGTLVRKEFMVFPLFLLGMIAMMRLLERPHAQTLRMRISVLPKLALFLLGMAIVLTPWVVRNYAVADAFILVSAHSGDALWLSTYPEDWQEWQPLPPELQKQLEGLTPIEHDAVFRREALKNLRAHPLAYLQMSGKRFIRFWIGSHTGTLSGFTESFQQALVAGHRSIFAGKALLLLLNTAIIVLGGVGAVWVLRNTSMPIVQKAILLSPIAFKMMLHTLTFSTSRYQIPIMPFVIILAAYAVQRWVSKSALTGRIGKRGSSGS